MNISKVIVFLTESLVCVSANAALPALPSTYLDTTYMPATGNSIAVNAGGDLQMAINSAQYGDEVVIAAGATFIGNYILPLKAGNGWITIRSSNLAGLPPAGTRVSPANAAAMPKLVSNTLNPAIANDAGNPANSGGHHYRLIGLEITMTPTLPGLYDIVQIDTNTGTTPATMPHDFVIDRCYIHGNALGSVRRGIQLGGTRNSIIESYISNMHSIYGKGTEAQAIAGWNGPGPYKIVNNYLEGSTENVIFGGAIGSMPAVIPSDIEFRHNYLSKPIAWRTSIIPAPAAALTGAGGGSLQSGITYYYEVIANGTAGYEGGSLAISSGFREVSISLTGSQGSVNVTWPGASYGDAADLRYPISYTVCRTTDLPTANTRTFVYYTMTPPNPSASSFSFRDVNGAPAGTVTDGSLYLSGAPGGRQTGDVFLVKNLIEIKNAQRLLFDSNVLEYSWASGQGGTAFVATPRSVSNAFPGAVASDITFTDNVIRHVGNGMFLAANDDQCTVSGCAVSGRYLLANNLAYDVSFTWQVLAGVPYGLALGKTNDLTMDHCTFVISGAANGAGAQLIYNLPTTNESVSHSIFTGDFSSTGVYGPAGYFTGSVNPKFSDNIVSNLPGSSNIQAWMAAAPNSFFPADISNIGFVDYTSANPNYTLAPASPYKQSSDDGRDLGVDFGLLSQKIPEVTGGTGSSSSNHPPSVISPANAISGTGTTAAFAVSFRDPDGYQDLNIMHILFAPSVTAMNNACFIEYDRTTDELRLYNDAGMGYVPGFIKQNSLNTLANSQCTIGSPGPVAVQNSTDLRPGLNVTFKALAMFNVYAEALDSSYTGSGWQQVGTWSSLANVPPSVVSVNPLNGSANSSIFTAVYSDPNGFSNLNAVYMLLASGSGFNYGPSFAASCSFYYVRSSNMFYLVNDAGSALAPGSLTAGGAGSLSNSQCTLSSGGSVTGAGNSLTVPIQVTFSPQFQQTVSVYAFALNNQNLVSSLQLFGTWTSGGNQPASVSVSPNTGTGASTVFTATYSDIKGASNLVTVYLLINSSLTSANACWLYYEPAQNQIYLVDDTGKQLVAGSVTAGASGSIANSQCTVSSGGAATKAGNQLSVPVKVTFATNFSGVKAIYGYALNGQNLGSAWQTLGTWKPF